MFETLNAQTPAGATASPKSFMDGAGSMLPIIAIFVVFYFLLIRPQQKRAKELDKRRSELKKGDRIVTAGGVYATVSHLKEAENIVVAEIADGVKVEIAKSTISQIIDDSTKNVEAKK